MAALQAPGDPVSARPWFSSSACCVRELLMISGTGFLWASAIPVTQPTNNWPRLILPSSTRLLTVRALLPLCQLSSATTHRSISPQNTRHYCLCQGELLPNMSQISTHNHCIIWLTDGMTTKTDHITSFMHLITKAETTNTVISQSQLENNFTVKLYQ